MKEERLKTLKRCLNMIQNAHDVLEEVRDDEQDAFDNLPEGLQYSERGDLMQEAVDNLDVAIDTLDDVLSSLESVETTADDPALIEIDPWQKLVVGDIVKHKSFGRGVIKEIDGKYFFIEFKEKTSKFIFPDAIDKGYITL